VSRAFSGDRSKPILDLDFFRDLANALLNTERFRLHQNEISRLERMDHIYDPLTVRGPTLTCADCSQLVDVTSYRQKPFPFRCVEGCRRISVDPANLLAIASDSYNGGTMRVLAL